jgi:hypothetical protein
MMDRNEVILLSIALGALAFRLFQKYTRKGHKKPGNIKYSGSSLSTLKDDDYEPYLKK